VDDDAGGYTMDHSASAVIIDPQGRRAGLFRPPFAVDPIFADIMTLTEAN
jgi:protein SCO1/2